MIRVVEGYGVAKFAEGGRPCTIRIRILDHRIHGRYFPWRCNPLRFGEADLRDGGGAEGAGKWRGGNLAGDRVGTEGFGDRCIFRGAVIRCGFGRRGSGAVGVRECWKGRGCGPAGIRWGTGIARTRPMAHYEDREGNAGLRWTHESTRKKIKGFYCRLSGPAGTRKPP